MTLWKESTNVLAPGPQPADSMNPVTSAKDQLIAEAYMEAAAHLEACAAEENDLNQKLAYRHVADKLARKAETLPNTPPLRI